MPSWSGSFRSDSTGVHIVPLEERRNKLPAILGDAGRMYCRLSSHFGDTSVHVIAERTAGTAGVLGYAPRYLAGMVGRTTS